jgi:hypothetical protein
MHLEAKTKVLQQDMASKDTFISQCLARPKSLYKMSHGSVGGQTIGTYFLNGF